jgi:hypothetical protein
VQILSAARRSQVQRRGPAVLSGIRTDDRGEFRIANLMPGSIVMIISPPLSALPPADNSAPKGQPMAYVPTYCPGVFGADEATAIQLQPGADRNLGDVKMLRKQVYRKRGRLQDADG